MQEEEWIDEDEWYRPIQGEHLRRLTVLALLLQTTAT